jgi:hypothetical protein
MDDFRVVIDGVVNVRHVVVVESYPTLALLVVCFDTKYYSVAAIGSDNDEPLISVDPTDCDGDTTDVAFPAFKDWSVRGTQWSKDELFVTLHRQTTALII